jgi:hypothetical protein
MRFAHGGGMVSIGWMICLWLTLAAGRHPF